MFIPVVIRTDALRPMGQSGAYQSAMKEVIDILVAPLVVYKYLLMYWCSAFAMDVLYVTTCTLRRRIELTDLTPRSLVCFVRVCGTRRDYQSAMSV